VAEREKAPAIRGILILKRKYQGMKKEGGVTTRTPQNTFDSQKCKKKVKTKKRTLVDVLMKPGQ